MLINQKEIDALYVTDNDKKILCIIEDKQTICRKGIKVVFADDYSDNEYRIKDVDGEPYLSMP